MSHFCKPYCPTERSSLDKDKAQVRRMDRRKNVSVRRQETARSRVPKDNQDVTGSHTNRAVVSQESKPLKPSESFV